MKLSNILLGALSTSLLMLSCTSQPPAGYTLQGEIEGATGKLYLTLFEGKLPSRVDSTEAVNGSFTFTGHLELPMLSSIENEKGQTLARFFLENAPIQISGSMANPAQITTTGSATNDLYNIYKAEMDSITPLLYNDSLARVNPATSDSMMQLITNRKMEFVGANPTSIAAAYVLYRETAYYLPFEELRRAVAGFDPAVQGSIYLRMVSTMADALERTAVGQPYTDISAPDTTGAVTALSSVVGEGKYVLLDFWASWCPPCRAECPVMVKAYAEYAPKGFEIFAVSLDKSREAWTNYIDSNNLGWKHVSEVKFWTSAAAESYGVRSIPSNVLIDPNGVIIARNLMGEELEAKLKELLR